MRIIIGGVGKFASYICSELCREGHEVTVIDTDRNVLETTMERYDVRTVEGSITSIDVQKEADMPSAEVFMALTSSDEINITSAIIARQLGSDHTVARVRDTEYGAHMGFMRNNLGISYLVNPEFESARYLAEMLQFPAVYAMDRFVNGAVTMMEAALSENSKLVGLNLIAFRRKYPSILVTCIARGEDIFIPGGDFVLAAHDVIQVTGSMKDLRDIYREFSTAKIHYREILLVGGGRITHYLLRQLQRSNLRITVIERNEERAMALAGEFPNVHVIIGDGTDHTLLEETNLENFDVILSLTGMDEQNIMISLHALKEQIPRTVTKISRVDILPLVADFGLQTILTPHRLAGEDLMRYIRAMDRSTNTDMDAVYHLMNSRVKAVEMRVNQYSKLLNKAICELRLKSNILIAYIYRKGQIIFPSGVDKVQLEDRVIVISLGHPLLELDDILAD